MGANVFAGEPARATLIGPLPSYILIPHNGREYEFVLGGDPVAVPQDLLDFLRGYHNTNGGPAFEITGSPALISDEPHSLGRQLVINL